MTSDEAVAAVLAALDILAVRGDELDWAYLQRWADPRLDSRLLRGATVMARRRGRSVGCTQRQILNARPKMMEYTATVASHMMIAKCHM